MNLEFFVKDKRVTRKGFQPVVADTTGHYTFTVAFDREWDGLVKVVVFQNGAETAQLIYTGQSALPDNVAKRGDLYVACHGYRRLGDSVAVVRTVRMTRPVRILTSAPMAGGDPARYTPTVFEQVMAAAGEAQTAAKDAKALTEDLERRRESGELNGPSGPPGSAATVTVGMVEEGTEAAVRNVGTAQNAILQFILPRGRGVREITDNWDGTWTVTFTDGEQTVLIAPGVTDHESGEARLAAAVAAYLAENPPPAGADGRGIQSVNYSAETSLWTVAYTDGTSENVTWPEIPSLLADLGEDANHRTVTDAEKATWNGKSDFSGSYNDLSNIPYATCSTSSSTTAKVAACSGAFTLKTGAMVRVKFTYYNSASSPTLNVNSTGAKSIKQYSTTALPTYMWQSGAVVTFVYDGTYWIMVGGTTATTTYYGLTKLSSSTSSTSTTLAATPSAVKSAYDLANAAMPKSGGTFTGAAYALSGAGTAAQLRNTALLAAETDPTVNGQINWTYE